MEKEFPLVDSFGLKKQTMTTNNYIHEKNLPILNALEALGSSKYKEYKEKFLIAEAKKRGFKKGVMINHSIEGKGHRALIFNELSYHSGYNWLCDGWGNVVFKDGVWAEIVKDEPIKIGGRYEVVFMGKKGTSDILYTKIDGHDFLKEFWQSAKVISEHSKAKIMIGCSKQFDVSLETINQILEKL